jgi:hypothetical protein
MTDSQPTGANDSLSTVDDVANALMQKWESDDSPTENPVEEQESIETQEVEASDYEVESEVQEPESEEDALTFESINELSEALGITPDKFLEQFKGRIKVDGEESEISLSEALNGYQRQADYQRKTAELAESRKQFEQFAANQQSQLQQNFQLAQAALQAADNTLMAEFQNIDWHELEMNDPANAVLYKQKFQERKAEIQNHFNQLMQHQKQQAMAIERQRSEAMVKILQQQKEMLNKVSPDWTDETSNELATYLRDNGFDPKEISGLIDHRQALLYRKAMMFDKQNKSVDVAKAKVKPLPKMLKPNSKTRNSKLSSQKVSQLKQRLKKSGTVQDAAALILERMN